jgi:exosome complex component RRP42
MSFLISPAERDYIVSGVDCDIRSDGRSRLDYRQFKVETGVVAQANGSSRVVLGGTEVLVGVKVEIGNLTDEISQNSAFLQQQDLFPCPKNRGKVVCSVEW